MIFFQCKSRIAIGIKENLVKHKEKRTSQDVVFIVFSSLIGKEILTTTNKKSSVEYTLLYIFQNYFIVS